jgi:hypothetical protein
MQMEDNFDQIDGNVMCLQFSVQEEDILEHTNGKCHLFAL